MRVLTSHTRKNHLLRQVTEFCDFSFIYDELEKNYRPNFGRKAYSLIMIFKYPLLKDIHFSDTIDIMISSLIPNRLSNLPFIRMSNMCNFCK